MECARCYHSYHTIRPQQRFSLDHQRDSLRVRSTEVQDNEKQCGHLGHKANRQNLERLQEDNDRPKASRHGRKYHRLRRPLCYYPIAFYLSLWRFLSFSSASQFSPRLAYLFTLLNKASEPRGEIISFHSLCVAAGLTLLGLHL